MSYSSCNFTTEIDENECIGDSLTTINANFSSLDVTVCNIDAKIIGKNKLINAQGLINQRGYISGTTTTSSNQYTLDRWKVVVLGQNLSFSTSENITTFTAPAGGVEQVIEGLNIETGTYVLNWTGSATATVNGTSISKGGTITLTGGSNVTIRFINGTFSLPQFETNTTITRFEYRPIGTELTLCQRYFFKSSDQGGGADPGSRLIAVLYDTVVPNSFSATYWHPTYMRTAPSTTTSSFTYRGAISNNTSTYNNGTIIAVDAAADKSSIRVTLPTTNNTFGSSTNIFLDANWKWSAEL